MSTTTDTRSLLRILADQSQHLLTRIDALNELQEMKLSGSDACLLELSRQQLNFAILADDKGAPLVARIDALMELREMNLTGLDAIELEKGERRLARRIDSVRCFVAWRGKKLVGRGGKVVELEEQAT